VKTTPRRHAKASYESHFEHAALFEFSSIINSSLDLRFILSHIVLTIMGKLLTTKAMVILAHDKRQYSVEMVKGFPREMEGSSIDLGRIPRVPMHLERVTSARFPWVTMFKDLGADIILPMHIQRRPVGLLVFGPHMGHRPLQRKEVTYLRSLANISATAIAKIHTIEELHQVNRKLDRKIQELNTLFELGKEFSAVLDPEKLVRLMVFSLLGQVGVNRYLICLRDGDEMRPVASRLDGPMPPCELMLSLTRLRGPVNVDGIPVKGGRDPRPALRAAGLSVVIPLQIQRQSRGFVVLGEKLNREPFGSTDYEFLSALGSLAIISLENARLFHEAIEKQKMEDELKIAREIQKGLLPGQLPSVPGFEVAAANFSSKQVGGDYYDVIPLDEHRFVVAIGDVSGKGTPAALLMANLQATIRALVPLEPSLKNLTARVNSLMCQNTGGSKFVTFFWGIVDHRSRELVYVNAGHNYPFLLHRDGSMERLETGGMILGVIETMLPYEEGRLRFRDGDVLVLFTDGVSEGMNARTEEFGEDRLEESIRGSRDLPADQIIARIEKDVIAHAGGAPQSDDITMMVLRVL
jgi:phosphoserine phosphatase RsbU/P